MKNWKTTTAAVLAALGAVAVAVAAVLDNDPTTTADWASVVQAIGAAMAVFGFTAQGILAKDADAE